MHEIDRIDLTAKRAEMLRQPLTEGDGPFQGTVESLQQFECPDWFRDAKFGIWAHWGPQSVPRLGDWYARNLYMQNPDNVLHTAVHDHHVATYGHPSEAGYKDVLPHWKAENFDPDHLIQLYKRVGARYFVALGVHADNFDCWDSTFHRWNSVNVGPKKDIVGLWHRAARAHGLRFGVSEHTSNYFTWLGPSMGSDKTGPRAGVPYDGTHPQYQDLYHSRYHEDPRYWRTPDDYPKEWAHEWFFRMKDLVDRYEPDLFYTDGALALDAYSLKALAYYYNQSAGRNGGIQEAVYTLKNHKGLGTYIDGVGIFDIERGLAGEILDEPWQIDTCLGDWFYKDGLAYKSPANVIHFLADVVSKNGNMLLNVPLLPDGTIDGACMDIMGEIEAWLKINGEAIYGTRPWRIYGEGMEERFEAKCHNEDPLAPSQNEFRFTRKGETIYAFIMGWPEDGQTTIRNITEADGIGVVELLGHGPVGASRTESGLKVALPSAQPCSHAWVLKLSPVRS